MATESNFVQPAIPKFDGHYDHWAMLMENFLRSKEYWSLVEHGIPAATQGVELTEGQRKASEDQKLKDLKAKNYLFQAIDRSILETILNKDTAKSIWDSLKQKYQGTARVKRAHLQALRREFEVLQMKEGESVNEYFARTLTIANKMRIHGETMGDVVVIEKILRSMIPKFNYVVCSIEESNDIDTLTIDQLQSSLLVHEQRMNGPAVEEQALKVTYEDRSRGGRGRGRSGFRGRGRGRGTQSYDKSTVECYHCHKLGHYQFECPSKEKETNFAEAQEEMLLMAYVDNNQATNEDVWFLDSGCSNHMCGKKELFTNLDESFRQSVKLGNNSNMAVKGKGNVRFQSNGISQTITGVFYIPELKNNLLSIGQLQEKGLVILFQHGRCKIYHSERGLIMETAMSSNRMFMLLTTSLSSVSSCFSTTTEDIAQLWHCRYGHLSFKGLKTLEQKKMVNGLPQLNSPSGLCEDCLVGKQQRDPFPKKSTWRASQILQLVHADICGPITPISNSKKRYLITFIDDYSRKTWVYFLVEKSQAVDIFKCFKNRVEKETGSCIRTLRTDRGGEFTSQEFNAFCDGNGISRQLTAAYTPQQNGVAERKNRTIMNMVRSMLSEKKIPRTFWPEAVNWTVHVLNRCPTLAVRDRTPEEAWSGVKPSVEYFRVFGCVSHVHIPDSKRTKLDNKSVSCVLLGVSEESKAYRMYDPISQKIIVSRDVVFEEDKNWNWNKRYEEQIEIDLEWGDNQDEDVIVEDSETGINRETEGEIESSTSDESTEGISANLPERRTRSQPIWMRDYESGDGLSGEEEDMTNLAMFVAVDPISFEDAVKSEKWRHAMDLELEAIEKNGTWELTDLPDGGKKIGVKWVYKTKLNENGEVDKYKARLVAKGYAQQHGVDYTEVFAPVARLDTIRLVIALAAQKGWSIYQLDVKSAFLHGELSEEVFVEQPRGYEIKGSEQKVYKLKKALYGLKQAPRAWYSRIESYFVKEGFVRCPHEYTLFIKTSAGGKILILSLYVDDLIFTGNDESMFAEFKKSMLVEFDMTNLGKMRYFLGIEVMQKSDGIFINQKKYVMEVLERFEMDKSNPVQNPIVPGEKLQKDENGVKVDSTYYKQIIGSLMYLTATRPDVMFVVSLISRYMEHPTKIHLQTAKKILRYLKGTVDYGVFYKKGGNEDLVAYTDSDYAGDLDDRKSTSGYVFLLSSGAVSWSSKKQPVVSLSTTEAEFIAAAGCACQTVWLRRILEKLGHTQRNSTTVYCDNSSAIKLAKNPVMHGRSKHIDVRFHFLRELTKDGTVQLVYCNTQEQVADVMTKPLKLDVFVKLRNLLGVCSLQNVN